MGERGRVRPVAPATAGRPRRDRADRLVAGGGGQPHRAGTQRGDLTGLTTSMSRVIGDDPLVDGMTLSLRLRRDFSVTDASRLLTTARRFYLELNPDSRGDDAAEMVTSAADAL